MKIVKIKQTTLAFYKKVIELVSVSSCV